MTATFDVHLYGQLVAELTDDGTGYLALRYVDGAAGPARRTVSLSLADALSYPAQRGTMRWLRTVLPEGDVLAAVAAHLRIDRDDIPGLLTQLGRDLVGAVRIVPSGERPELDSAAVEPASHDDIVAKITRLPTAPLGVDRERGHRMSLGGMQPKVVLCRHDGSYGFPINGAASTVIAKPEPADQPGLVDNEAALLRLAAAAGLPAATATVEQFGEHRTLVVDRFDRQDVDGRTVRIHQEEAVAALGLQPADKYQKAPSDHELAGGPRLRDLAALLSTHAGAAALRELLDQTVFHLATGNADAHMRNHGLLLPPDGSVHLTPLYDTVCTLAVDGVDTDLSLRVGSAYSLLEVGRSDLLEETAAWGLSERLVVRRVDDLLERLEVALDRVDGPDRVLQIAKDRIALLR